MRLQTKTPSYNNNQKLIKTDPRLTKDPEINGGKRVLQLSGKFLIAVKRILLAEHLN